MNIEDKTNLRVNEMAMAAGVSAETVRYYTRAGLLKPNRDVHNNYRLYVRGELTKLIFIRRAKTLGYTLSEIKKIIQASMNKKSPCPMVREIISNRIKENKNHMDEVIALQKRMESAVRVWKQMPDAIPTGDSICHLIELDT